MLTFGIVFVACDMRAFVYFGSMYLIRLRMEPSCSMEFVSIAGKYGFRCPIRWKGICMICGSLAPFLASLLASSFPRMFVWALTFLILIL